MKLKFTFLLLFFAITCPAAPIPFTWMPADQPTNVAGYYLYAMNQTNILKFDAKKSTNYTANLPPGTWTAAVKAYSTNNSSMARVEGVPSNEVRFYIPQAIGLDVNVDAPYAPPLLTLASNAQARVTIYLQKSANLVAWTEGAPLLQVDVRDGTNAFYRTRMDVTRLGQSQSQLKRLISPKDSDAK